MGKRGKVKELDDALLVRIPKSMHLSLRVISALNGHSSVADLVRRFISDGIKDHRNVMISRAQYFAEIGRVEEVIGGKIEEALDRASASDDDRDFEEDAERLADLDPLDNLSPDVLDIAKRMLEGLGMTPEQAQADLDSGSAARAKSPSERSNI